jgi:biotin transporter BioY
MADVKETAQEFTESFGFIVYFLIICFVLSLLAGEKVTRGFLYLVLIGMIFTNTDKLTSLLGRYK